MPSANVPSAVKANPVCAAMLALAGEIFSDVNCGLTRTVLVPVTAPNCAEIVAFPAETPPTLPVLSTAATAGFEEVQVASPVISCVVPSLSVAVAVKSTKVFGRQLGGRWRNGDRRYGRTRYIERRRARDSIEGG